MMIILMEKGVSMNREDILRLKKEKKYSAAQLSDLSGVPLGTLTKILSGETKNPRVDTMKAIEDVLLHENVPGDLDPHRYELKPSETLMVAEKALTYGVPVKEQGEYTRSDLECLPEGRLVELIDGVIYDMASPTLPHQNIAQSMFLSVFFYVQKKGGKCHVSLAPVDVFLDCDDRTSVIPDLFIVCDRDKLSKKGVNGAPDFILEVLSPSSVRKDKLIKTGKYLDAGVREYWIIDPDNKMLIIYDCVKPDTKILPLKGKQGIGIFGGEPLIDLDELRRLAEEFD